MSAWDGEDRFSLLLLEDGEYYFRDYNCHYWKQSDHRVAGQLKVCSASLFFVPRDSQEPIFRLPYRNTSLIARAEGERTASGEDMLRVTSTERIEMKVMNRNAPYLRYRGEAEYLFSLVYTSLDEILPRIKQLWTISKKDDTKEGRLEAKDLLDKVIQDHEANERFNPGWLEDENERILLELVGNCITALCSQPGRVVITFSRIYFQPFNVVSNNPIQAYHLDKVSSVMKRTYQLKPTGLEMFFNGRHSLYLTFKTFAERERVDLTLRDQPAVRLQAQRSFHAWVRDWVAGRVSNFEYLMFLNHQAGRSFKDLTQYPVFPWVIKDYTSTQLDLSNPTTFRDLSKPIGALNPKRLAEFRERYLELKRMCEASNFKLTGSPPPLEYPPFLYGCHYSTPGYVVYYLMRSEPQLMLRLQNGRFDAPDRLFWSIVDTWKSVMSLPTDVKELIPEFYSTDPSFLLNLEEIDFGTRATGDKVGNLELPPWASDAQDFVQKLAEALESPTVSARLHRWIDLVFGFRSRGRKAEEADNVFHYLTYDDIALQVLAQEQDPVMREALRVQMVEFGRTPHQLFTKKHPKRRVSATGARRALCCLKPAPPKHATRPNSNILTPNFQKKREGISPTTKAVARLTSSKAVIRQATLAWLEQAGIRREPEYLSLTSHTELLVLVRSLRDYQEAFPQADDMPATLVCALRVLAIAPLNRSFILEAGALEPLTHLLCIQPTEVIEATLYAVSLLSREEDARLNSLPQPALKRLLDLLADPEASPEIRATAASTLTNLSRSLQNRGHITQHGGLEVYMNVISRRESGAAATAHHRDAPRVAREAMASLLALLEDDQTKLDAVAMDCLGSLLDICSARGPDNELRALAIQCIAALSMHFDLKEAILSAGAVQVLCRIAKLQQALLQAPTAAALANLCSDPAFIGHVEDVAECFAALSSLSLSGNRDVQKHVARALWHLATAEESRQLLLEQGGVTALLRLAQFQDPRSLQSKTLAQQALKRLAEDQALWERLQQDVQAAVETSVGAHWNSLLTQSLVPSPGRGPLFEEAESSGGGGSAGGANQQPASPSKRRKHRRLQSAADDSGHGDVRIARSEVSSPWDSLDPFATQDTQQTSKPTLLNRLGFRRSTLRPSAAADGAVEGPDSPSASSFVGSDSKQLGGQSLGLPSAESLLAYSQPSTTASEGADQTADPPLGNMHRSPTRPLSWADGSDELPSSSSGSQDRVARSSLRGMQRASNVVGLDLGPKHRGRQKESENQAGSSAQ